LQQFSPPIIDKLPRIRRSYRFLRSLLFVCFFVCFLLILYLFFSYSCPKFKEITAMFDLIIREAASRFGLGDKAGPLVEMLVAYLTNKDTGGLSGFMSKLTSSGLGNVAQSWLGGGAGALPVSSAQIESLLGGQGGLIGSITSKLGIGGATASSALGFLLPMVIGKLSPGGSVPTAVSGDVKGAATAITAVTGGAAAATVAASKIAGNAGQAASSAMQGGAEAVADTGGGLMKWLPWLAAAIAGLFLLSYCSRGDDAAKQAADSTKAKAAAAAPAAPAPLPTATVTAVAPGVDAAKAAEDAAAAKAKADSDAAAAKTTADATKPASDAAPAGAGLVSYLADGLPALKVYFDTGKTDVPKEFGDKSKDIAEFLKANAGAKAIVSGFNDPTGNAAANAELSKNRAKGVAAALKAAGIAEDRVVLEKPTDTAAGSAQSNAEARRVEVTIRK
jgi:outer membrane protein OmpA-like peptidoglycan-associated protein/uncharacterized protein YidB (DUF937 family)